MKLQIYKMIHLLGLVMAFVSVGGLTLHGIAGGDREHAGRKLALMTHGFGMFLALLGGFGLHATMGGPWEGWVMVKIGLWVLLGGAVALAARKPSPAVWWGLLGLFAVGAWLALFKPF